MYIIIVHVSMSVERSVLTVINEDYYYVAAAGTGGLHAGSSQHRVRALPDAAVHPRHSWRDTLLNPWTLLRLFTGKGKGKREFV